MPSPRLPTRPTASATTFAAGCAAIAAAIAATAPAAGDYVANGDPAGDNPAPAIEALVHGRVGEFISHQPLMGLVSIALRVPAVGFAHLAGAGQLTAYRLGSFVCLLLISPIVWAVIRRAQPPRRILISLALACVAALVGGPVRSAVGSGHPEEVLASVLATAAVLAALDERHGLAGVLLGLAIGTKQWAIVGIVPVLLALPARRLRTVAFAAVAGLATTLPAALADPSAFARAGHEVAGTHLVNPMSIWWSAGSSFTALSAGHAAVRVLPFGITRAGASLPVLLAALLASAWIVRSNYQLRRRRDALALLALVMVLRCLCDPLPLEYYLVPVVVALAAWEIAAGHRLPLLTALVSVLGALTVHDRRLALELQHAFALAWMLPLSAYLGCAAKLVGAPSATRLNAASVLNPAGWKTD